MAKASWIEREKKRARLVAKTADARKKYKAVIRKLDALPAERDEAIRKLQALPRNGSPVRITNRCQVSGRSKAYIRRFGLSRIAFREMALEGKIPGVRKASW